MPRPDEYNDYDEYDDYADEYKNGRALVGQDQGRSLFNLGINGSILVIIVLTLIYTLSPIDAIPDFIPLAGQADDIAAIAAGSGSVLFLSVLRLILRNRITRWGCLIVLGLTVLGTLTVFWLLLRVFDSIF
ncbi:MAG: DUF1232 domain-containing protein [Anaerolineae bacterium]|nr:DUF1232 domain-containing protein [Anaerolineae bacterium]